MEYSVMIGVSELLQLPNVQFNPSFITTVEIGSQIDMSKDQ